MINFNMVQRYSTRRDVKYPKYFVTYTYTYVHILEFLNIDKLISIMRYRKYYILSDT